MRLNPERRAQLEATLPPAESTRERVFTHMRSLDLPIVQFAPFTGYSAAALRSFLNGHYLQQTGVVSDVVIRAALEDYLAANPLAANTPTDTKLYETENVSTLRYWFGQCQQHGYMAVGYGPPGSQKTFAAQHLVAEFNARQLDTQGSRDRAYLVRCSIGIRPRDLLAKVCREIGLPAGSTLQRCMSSLRLGLVGRRVLLVIDECQLAGIPALEALRELHDDQVGLLLLGSHALRQFFDARAAELEQFNSRIEESFELTGITEASAEAILAAELPSLAPRIAAQAVRDSFVPDIYSRVKGKRYCSVRRLFKSIAAYRELQAEQSAANPKEVIQ